MEITKLLSLAADEEKNAFDGLFSGAGGIVGIVLIVTGVLIIYIGIKVMKGYSFMPTLGVETVIEEDTYVEGTATLVSQQKMHHRLCHHCHSHTYRENEERTCDDRTAHHALYLAVVAVVF